MPELDEVVDDSADTSRIRGAHHVQRRAWDTPTDHDDRCPVGEFRESCVLEFWAEQDQRLATEVQQCVDDRRFAVRGCHRAEHHFVAEGVGFGHDVLDQFSVKSAANIGHNADEV